MLIERTDLRRRVLEGLRASPVTALLGPRQCGKTTLAREIARGRKAEYLDLESAADHARLQNPSLVLEPMKGMVVLDEIQRRPDLMPVLRVLADRRPVPCRFLILGSASPDLVRHASESLAGRVHFVDMAGLALPEVGADRQDKLWLRGGLPNSFMARTGDASWKWREDYIRTVLERDLPQLGIQVPSMTLRRFWTMLAHFHGQIWNGSEIGASLGIAHTTTRRYLDILTGAFMVRQLPPWYENVGKRVVKSPKAYIRDSGLLHSLLGIRDRPALESHPKLGASWEGFAIEQILAWAGERNAYFWATHRGAELDLLLRHGNKRWGFEFKCADAPTASRSMHIALDDLGLEKIWVLHPGSARYRLHEKIECVGLGDLGSIEAAVLGRRRSRAQAR